MPETDPETPASQAPADQPEKHRKKIEKIAK